MLNIADGMPPRLPLKRHLSNTEIKQETKRRIVDNLSTLSLSGNWGTTDEQNTTTKAKSGSPGLFGSDSPLLMSHQNMAFTQKKKYNDDEPIIINNIDDFLRRNPDDADFLGDSIVDYKNVDMEKIYIPNLNQLSDIYVVDPMNEKQAFSYERIFARKQKQKSLNNDQTPIEITNSEIYYDQYILQNFSLVKWYDPVEVIITNLEDWFYKNQKKIEELERTDYNMTDEYDNQISQPNPKMTIDDEGSQAIDYNTWTSGYGSYYQSPNSFTLDAVPDDDEMDID